MLSSMRHRFALRLAAAALLGGVLWGPRNSVEARPRGKAVYDAHCVECRACCPMPWPLFSSWSEEDRHAVVVYLRHLKPIAHRIPDPVPGNAITIPGAIEQDYGGKDYGISQKPPR